MKSLSKIGILLLNILIAIFLPCVFFTLILAQSAFIGGIRSFDVRTGSMEPTLHVGTIIYTFSEKTYAVGDIIAFERNNISVTHRIVGVQKKYNQTIYITKGDANPAADVGQVSQSSIIGKVMLQIPYIGKFIDFLKTILGFLLFIVVPSIFIIVTEFNTIKKELEKEFEKKFTAKAYHEA